MVEGTEDVHMAAEYAAIDGEAMVEDTEDVHMEQVWSGVIRAFLGNGACAFPSQPPRVPCHRWRGDGGGQKGCAHGAGPAFFLGICSGDGGGHRGCAHAPTALLCTTQKNEKI